MGQNSRNRAKGAFLNFESGAFNSKTEMDFEQAQTESTERKLCWKDSGTNGSRMLCPQPRRSRLSPFLPVRYFGIEVQHSATLPGKSKQIEPSYVAGQFHSIARLNVARPAHIAPGLRPQRDGRGREPRASASRDRAGIPAPAAPGRHGPGARFHPPAPAW